MTREILLGQAASPRPVLYRRDRFAEFSGLLRQVAQMTDPPKAAYVDEANDDRRRLYYLDGNVAVIPIRGILLNHFPYVVWPYATGYDALYCQFSQAFADPEVKAIVPYINSGGGEVAGCFDLVDWIVQAKASAGKPVLAVLDECAFSAAYALASAADSIAVPRTGGVGSIGVIMAHYDMSGWLKQVGLDVTLIKAGEHKADGNAYEPLPEAVEEQWQADCEELRVLFCETVSRNRSAAGVKVSANQLMSTEAAVFEGPSGLAAAIKLGLADEVISARAAMNRVLDQMAGA
ncbi:MAG: S49 family peptidase [Rhodospirillaceae bacterium]|nr:MAG: S49 family peptidase [Rhodospirillaceae bacterium]